MTAHVATGRPANPSARPWSPRRIAVASGVLACCIQLLAGWPGWMTRASVDLWHQAADGRYTDWYAPMLAWFWQHAQPVEHGSLVPFLLQLELFWAGVTMIAVGLQPAARWTRFLPLIVLVNPATWMVMFLWRETFVLCVLTAATGVASLGMRAVRRGDVAGSRVPLWCAAIIAGLACVAWPRSLPLAALLVVALCLVVLPRAVRPRVRLQILGKAVLLVLLAGMMAAYSLPRVLVGDVVPTRADEASYALDAYRIDCASYWATGKSGTDQVSPAGLWQDGAAPCKTGNPASYGAAWTGWEDQTGTQLLGFDDWLRMAAQHPGIVIGGRVQQVAAMLAGSFTGVPDVSGAQVVSAPAAAGQGEAVDSASRGGVLLAAYAGASAFIPGMLMLWIVLIPIATARWLAKRRRPEAASSWGVLWPVLAWPCGFAAVAGFVAASTDPNAIATAAALAWVLALWTIGLDSAGGLPPRTARPRARRELNRYRPAASPPRRRRSLGRTPTAPAALDLAEPDLGRSGSLSAFAEEHAAELHPDEHKVLAGADAS